MTHSSSSSIEIVQPGQGQALLLELITLLQDAKLMCEDYER
ncbi:hypothetical protein [Dictyobacter arantiisoli]|nr:hypothetical protein [Dictyobacter arantiisoli]